MSAYILGILAAFTTPILHAWANIIDNHLANKLFQKIEPLIFFSAIIELCILPIIIFIDPPHLISLKFAAIIFVISFIEVVYLFPYYYALRHADTSIVASLFSLGKLFVPIFAFLLINEKLSLLQYAGFLILTLSGVILSIDFKKMTLSKALVLMFIVSALLAAQAVLLKYAYEAGMGWGTSIFWITMFQFIISACLFIKPDNLKNLTLSIPKIKAAGKLLLLMEVFTYIGTLGGSYALYLIPVSVAKGISSTQPVFVLIYAFIFSKFYPNFFKEYLGKDGVVKKVILFVLTIVGVLLIS